MCIDTCFIDVHYDKTYFIYVYLLVCYMIIIILNEIYLFCMGNIFFCWR